MDRYHQVLQIDQFRQLQVAPKAALTNKKIKEINPPKANSDFKLISKARWPQLNVILVCLSSA